MRMRRVNSCTELADICTNRVLNDVVLVDSLNSAPVIIYKSCTGDCKRS